MLQPDDRVRLEHMLDSTQEAVALYNRTYAVAVRFTAEHREGNTDHR